MQQLRSKRQALSGSAQAGSPAAPAAPARHAAGPAAAAPASPGAAAPASPGAAAPAPTGYSAVGSANPYSLLQGMGQVRQASGWGGLADMVDLVKEKAKAASAEELAANPCLAASDPKGAIQKIRKLPPEKQLEFAHALLADKNLTPAARHEMLQMLTAPAAGSGKKPAVSLDDVCRTSPAAANEGLEQMLADEKVGPKLAKQIGKSTTPETQARLSIVAGADMQAMANLLTHASKDGLNQIFKSAAPETLEKLNWAMSWMDESALERMAKSLTPANLDIAANSFLDHSDVAGQSPADTLAVLVGAMKPADREDFLQNAYDDPDRSPRIENLAKFSDVLQDPAQSYGD